MGDYQLAAEPAADGTTPELLFCDNETNSQRLFGTPSSTAWPKDGINDHVIGGAPTVNPDHRGTKCAFWYQQTVAPGATVELRLRLRPSARPPQPDPTSVSFDQIMDAARARSRRVLR